MNAEPLSKSKESKSTDCLGRVAILWRGDESARRTATAASSRFKDVFAALADAGVDAEPVVYEDDVLDATRAQLAAVDGVLVWVNPIHEGRNRATLDALLREIAARGIWVSAHPDVIPGQDGHQGGCSIAPERWIGVATRRSTARSMKCAPG